MKVFITGARRSPIGSFLGSFSNISAADLASQVVIDLLAVSKTPINKIDEVLVGQVLPAGQGQGVGRQVSLGAGLDQSVPAYTLNMVCGSGMKTVMNGFTGIKAGLQNIVVAGGVEVMSAAPFLVPGANRLGVKMGQQTMEDHMLIDSLTDVFTNTHMGITAENIAEKHNMTREQLDEFSIGSQEKAIAADDAGNFVEEITPIKVIQRRKEVIIDKDEYINRTTSLEILAKLRPAFKRDGIVTAGTSSGINDGASFVVVASEKAIIENNLTPLVEIVAIGQGGVDPNFMGLGPVPAISKVLKAANLKLQDMDVLELNEAFAAQSLGVITELSEEHGMSMEDILAITNPNGGAISLGHPLGASGNRIIVTLIHEMLRRDDVKYGLASLCIGGGMGTAIIVKKV